MPDSARRAVPPGYSDVDPRTARRVPLWRPLGPDTPIFPGDPGFTAETWYTVGQDGYQVERITSLGTHTGTHVSAPAHFAEGAATLGDLDEEWTLLPLAVLQIRPGTDRFAAELVNGYVTVPALAWWERRYGPIPAGGCVLLLTGRPAPAAGPDDTTTPGIAAAAVEQLFDERRIRVIGADSFGPDAAVDTRFTATAAALARGGLTVENVGPGLAEMRPYGDWIAINGARPAFSGFPVGITGFTLD